MKKYITPEVEKLVYDVTDIITESGHLDLGEGEIYFPEAQSLEASIYSNN